jgi:hypothetical protein
MERWLGVPSRSLRWMPFRPPGSTTLGPLVRLVTSCTRSRQPTIVRCFLLSATASSWRRAMLRNRLRVRRIPMIGSVDQGGGIFS